MSRGSGQWVFGSILYRVNSDVRTGIILFSFSATQALLCRKGIQGH